MIKNTKDRHNIESWDSVYDRRMYRWAGHVARLKKTDPKRMTHQVFIYRDWRWLKTIEAKNKGRQLHGRCLKIWRWERPMYKAAESLGFESDWQTESQDNDRWAELIDELVEWRADHR